MKIKIIYEQENDEAVYSIERDADGFTIYPEGNTHITVISSRGTLDEITEESGVDKRVISIEVKEG